MRAALLEAYRPPPVVRVGAAEPRHCTSSATGRRYFLRDRAAVCPGAHVLVTAVMSTANNALAEERGAERVVDDTRREVIAVAGLRDTARVDSGRQVGNIVLRPTA